MRPTDYPLNIQHLHALWHQQRSNGRVGGSSKAVPFGLDPVVWESWQRCRQHFATGQLHPEPQAQRPRVQRWLESYADLTTSAVPYLEDIFEFTKGLALAVILADSDGRIIAIQSQPNHMAQLTPLGLQVGGNWHEQTAGTNALALSLLSAMPTQVIGPEHYFERFHSFGMTAAPVHDAFGRMAGGIALITPAEKTDLGQLALVMATARAITNQLQSNQLLEQSNQRVSQLDAILEAMPDGVITWNRSGQIDHANSRVGEILMVAAETLLGQPVAEALHLPETLQAAMAAFEARTDEEINLQIESRSVPCLASLRPLWAERGQPAGGVLMLRPIAQVRSLVSQQTGSRAGLTFDDFQSQSVRVQRLVHQAQVAARSPAPVLLVGEGGVGKNALAHAIHNGSPRANGPLTVVNCRAIPQKLLMEELLGIAGDSSNPGRPSKFELAEGGTLLLDQVDLLPLEAQAALQQVIDARHIVRLYANHATPVNARVITTSTVDLQQRVVAGAFLPQLYYMLNIVKLALPPLRERQEDILFLAQRYLARRAGDHPPVTLSEEAQQLLERYPWPGNVRELESVLERALLHAQSGEIHVSDLPENIRVAHVLQPANPIPQPLMTIDQAEREAIIRAGHAHRGALTQMAETLGINRTTLWRKLKQHNLTTADFKPRRR